MLKIFLELKGFCSFLFCASKKKIYILCSGLLLSLIYYITGARKRKMKGKGIAKECIWQHPIDFHFLLHQITAKKYVFHKWCSGGVNCQNVFAEELLS